MSKSNKSKVSVDIIIPTYRPDDQFYKSLEMLLNQTVKTIDKVDETDNEYLNKIFIMNTEEKFFDKKKFQKISKGSKCVEVRHITKAEFDHGGTRNFAASLSRADIIMFMTQDAVPENERLIEELIQPLKEKKVAASYGRQLPNGQAGEIERYTREFNYPSKSIRKSKKDIDVLGIKTYFCSNVCCAYKRDVYMKLGGFVTQTIFNEDMIFASKIIQNDYTVAYAADARVIHSHKYTYREQFTRNFDLGVSQRQYREIFENIKSESEGIDLVIKTEQHLIKKGKFYLIPDLVMQSGFKFLGYRAGLQYEKLSDKTVRRFSMNKTYWDKCKKK
ncbi:glycosyltransferase [Anaerosporobacter sp.]|uniref:glycosyltransferase n=1 Tax=Anaerosporobacter sp. TaxID=1872529 RepID=UPI00286F04F6|nr:glycosyltransferase family 2 protein [Anaerosporobacter sp.]